MIFNIDNIKIIFPYDYIYPEQYKYMCDLKQSIDSKCHCLLEMPCVCNVCECLCECESMLSISVMWLVILTL